MAGQGRRLWHPGRGGNFRRAPVRQFLRRDGPAAARDREAAGRIRLWAIPGRPRRSGVVTEEILVNVTPRETRVAVVENGMLQELHIERGWRRGDRKSV